MIDLSRHGKIRLLTAALILYLPLSFLTPVVMYQLRDNNRLIVIDGRNSYHITEYADQERLIMLYEYTARLATDALFMRNPNGLDRPELFDEMYTGQARNKALDLLKAEFSVFGTRDIHQKVEILRIKVLEADSKKSFVEIEGQLLRSVHAEGKRESSVVKFSATMSLNVNFDLDKNALYPFIVSDFTYNEQKN
ncbi:hypothetical protein HF882_00165 [Victivallis vadensis]|uniref:Uncharacterized protein n=1 Tax=Victivallis vadensis TaxID=172901 RepID=A0A848AUV6_9BACT|nr:hypothetical protein [Victivallis vadensis]NMD84989.1 hypothetical protein [Victivallis vadensis]PWM22958.1 MAG: hypothetical protein DBX40_08375 [Clostridiales bacterium]